MTAEELEIKRARQREACKRYAERHPERRREQYTRSNKKRYWAHREERLAKAKVWRELNRERINAEAKQRRLDNKDLYRQRARSYYMKHKDKRLAYQSTPSSRYSYALNVARNRGIKWNISQADYFELISTPRCHYRNHPLDKKGVGLDRVDNTRGYVIGNVVPCCGECNRIKCHLLTYEEMLSVGQLLDQMRLRKALEVK